MTARLLPATAVGASGCRSKVGSCRGGELGGRGEREGDGFGYALGGWRRGGLARDGLEVDCSVVLVSSGCGWCVGLVCGVGALRWESGVRGGEIVDCRGE